VHYAPGLDEVDLAIVEFARQIARDVTAIIEADVKRWRDYGLTDTDIFDVATPAAVRCLASKLLDALGAAPDAELSGPEQLLERQLSTGRSMSQMSAERLEQLLGTSGSAAP